MKSLSISFVLGKASSPHGANINHNNRKTIADNVDINRIKDNITYVEQDIYDAYDELFSESLEEYNSKQKRNDRKIEDYYSHIAKGKREEPFYEAVVQFGDFKNCGVGTLGGDVAKNMLDEYMREFQKRNKNLFVFNATLHLDEATPHLHIDFIPYYTHGKKNGLSKGVSMRAALLEQGCYPRNGQANQLVAWEERERQEMVRILARYNFQRDFKNDSRPHLEVDEYKRNEQLKMVTAQLQKNMFVDYDRLKIQSENAALKAERKELLQERNSPWKLFYYSSPDKQSFVQSKLDELDIPYREIDSGFEAQECYIFEIRKFEKQFKPKTNSLRDKLRDDIDKFILQSKNYDELLLRLKNSGYEIKQGKYLSFKHKFGNQFIRVKSLGEDYSEIALKNRFVHKQRFETDINTKIAAAEKQNPDSIQVIGYKTVRQYTLIFAQNLLPMRKLKKNKPFTWTNDAELDKLSELNRKINAGLTIEKARNEFINAENVVSKHFELEKRLPS